MNCSNCEIPKNSKNYRDLAIAGFIVLVLYALVKLLEIFNLNFSGLNNYSNLGTVFLVGITAGLSTCLSTIGGLVLGAGQQKFRSHIFFNAGRVFSYFVFGGLIGFLGSFFQLSPIVSGILTIIVGVVMLLLGLQLTEIFPAIRAITLPKISLFADRYKNPAILGALTFFLPCGFTQAMQLFAISSGSALTGALTMGVFAIGTAPGLLGIGGLTSIIKGVFRNIFFKTAGIIVLLLAIFNISNGWNLTGFDPSGVLKTVFIINSPEKENFAKIQNGVQIVEMTQDGSGYHPNNFTIKKGVPVRWIINSLDAYNCASSLVVPKFNIRKKLNTGENIIEFTPTQTGAIKFSCSMGMYSGIFNVN